LVFAIGSTPGFDDGALSSFHGSRRVTQFVQWAAPPAPELPVGSIVGGVLGGVALLLVVVVLIVVAVRYFHQEARDETGLIDGERVPLGAALTETELQHLPVRLVNASAGVFFDPVLEEAFDEPALCQLRASQEERQAPAGGVRLLQLDKIYVDVLTLRNAATQRAHTFKIHLPPIAPQYIIDVEPTQFRLAAGASKVLQVRIVMLCTTAQNIAIKVSVDDESVGELPPIRVESELSTALDFDEVAVQKRIGEGANGVVFAGTWRGQPVAVKLLRQEVFSAHDLADLKAEARLLGQLLHKNVVGFRGISVEPTRCCLVTELAPFGSLKSVLDRSANEKRALPFAYLRHVCSDAASAHVDDRAPRHQAGQPARLQPLVERNRCRQADRLWLGACRQGQPDDRKQGRHHADGVERQVRPRRHADLHGAGAVRRQRAPERGHRRARARHDVLRDDVV
jgi:hypothetical protein